MLTPLQALQQYFGFDHFRPGQEETIQRVLQGQSILLVMPTGSGKSLAYQLPALLGSGLTLVISPLIALMQDQVDSLVEAGLPATFINSSLPARELNRRLRAVREGNVKLLYVAPERLRNREFIRVLANLKISLLAVDEAHCLSQWGHDFRPDYLQIGPTWQAMGRPTLLATTATATPAVQKDIIKLLGLKQAKTIVTGFNRPNLTFRVTPTPDARTKLQALQALLSQIDGSTIVYTATRRNTDEVADFVHHSLGLPAGAYHAGLDRDIRYQVQTDFMADRLKVVVATNAFGMGVDKPDVRAVIHYNLPATIEAYYQEAGRAGRDGLPAECMLLFAPDDQRLQEWLINSDTPGRQDLNQIYHLLSQAANEGEVYFSPRELAEMSGLHPVTVRVALSELELAEAIFNLGQQSGYGHWRVLTLNQDRLQARVQAMAERSQFRLKLLARMIDYAHLTTCRRRFLLDYFGDVSPPQSPRCCDNHAADSPEDLPKAATPQEWYPLIVLETVRTVPRPIGRRRLAQLLAGSRAKGIQQFGYDRHKFYGKLEALSQPQLTGLIDALIAGRYLRLVGGDMPVLTLSPTGQQALETRAALPVRVPGPAPKEDPVERRQKRADRSDTVRQTFELFQQGLSPSEIAAERDLAESTIYTHLARLIGEGKVELGQIVPAEIEAQVLEAVERVGSAAQLTPLKTILPHEISYDQIRCVLAAHPELPAASPSVPAAEKPEQRVVALGKSGDPEQIPELAAALEHENGNVRRLAASALGKIGHPRAVEPLLALLTKEPRLQVRQYAIKALGRIGDPRARTCLEKIVANSEEQAYNVKAARLALENIRKTHKIRPPLPEETAASAAPAPPPAPAPDPSPDTIILEAAGTLGGTLGRTGLAQFLTGSRSAWLEAFAQHRHYGCLAGLSQQAVLNIIDALITDGQLLTTGGNRPKVILPDQRLPPAPAPSGAPDQAPPPPVSPIQPLDQTLLETLRIWRTEQAKAQQVPPYIIFSNKVLEAIAARRPATLAELAEISGVGPAKLEQYGAEILALVTGHEPDQSEPGESPLAVAESAPPLTPSQAATPRETIIAVVTDLDGLLTVEGLARLLTAGPDEIVSFSDHPQFAALRGILTAEEAEQEIRQAIGARSVALSAHQRLILPP
jgi:ATP-dependent DNA helicase RecQ